MRGAVILGIALNAPSAAMAQSSGAVSLVISSPRVETHVVRKNRPNFELKTSKAAWKKICGGRNTMCGEMQFAGKRAIPVLAVAFLADTIVGVFTVPYDVLATPFRWQYKTVSAEWTVHGRITDADQNPIAGALVAVHASLIRTNELEWCDAAQASVSTNAQGYFLAKMKWPRDVRGNENMRVQIQASAGGASPEAIKQLWCARADGCGT